MKKRNPIPLDENDSLTDLINDFLNKMEEATGGPVSLTSDQEGNVCILYESPNKNKPSVDIIHEDHMDLDALLRGNEKSLPVIEKTKQVRKS
jgi:hypothetical protein